MNYFANEFSRIMDRKVANIYQLAKIINMDRTSIQHIKSGARMPGEGFVDKISSALALTYSERDHLNKCYIMSKIGKKRYYERNRVKNLVESLANIDVKPEFIQFSLENSLLNEKVNNKTISGQYSVQNLLYVVTHREIEHNESPSIVTTIPFAGELNVGMLLGQYLFSDKNVSITHILRLYSEDENVDDNSNNIAILQNVLRFALNPKGRYLPYYYYTKQEEHDDFFLPFPYFYMTSRCVVMVSADYQTAVYINDKEIYKTFVDHVKDLKARCNLMVDTLDFVQYLKLMEGISNGGYAADFGGSPCIGRFLTEKYINKYIVDELPFRDKLVEGAIHFYEDGLQKPGIKFLSFFMKEGLRSFAKTGRLGYYPEFLVKTFTVEDRICLLNMIRKDADYFNMIASEKLQIPHNVIFEMNNEGEVMISYIDDSQMRCCKLNDAGLSTPFYDFKDNVLLTELCAPKEEMIEVIDECLEELELMKKQEDRKKIKTGREKAVLSHK